MSKHTELHAERAKKSGAPTSSMGGSIPGGPETANRENAYVRPDATQPGTLPTRIADGAGDPTGNKNRDHLLAVAQTQGIDGAAAMNRHELVDALKATMSSEDLVAALVV